MLEPSLIVNPRARLHVEPTDGAIDAIAVRAPVKNAGLCVTTIRRETDSAIFSVLLIYKATLDTRAATVGLSDAERSRLKEIGFLIHPDQASEPVAFVCDVENLPTDALPLRARATDEGEPPPQVASSRRVESLGADGPTEAMRGRLALPNPFQQDRAWFRVEDPELSAPGFYSCAPEHATAVQHVFAGTDVHHDLSRETVAQLARAGVLQSPSQTAVSRVERTKRLGAARAELQARRYTVLRDVIRPLQLAAVRRYYRDLIAQGFVQFGDADWPNRYFAKRDALAYCFHQQLTDVVSDVAGERVKPSFAFLTSYCAGSVLRPHKDREQCHYSLSILLDHQPEPDDVSPWPIYVQPPGAETATPIHNRLGDGLLYFGEEVLHYREPLQSGSSTLWFFFYVPESFSGALD